MPFKLNPLTGQLDLVNTSNSGTVTAVTASSPLFSSGGTTPNITIQQATTSQDGYLSSVDWNTFNNKQPAGNYITALTGDATASGPGSVPITFATVNANVGSFGTSSSVGSFTVNAKGLVTAASNTSIQITESQVTNLVTDLANKQSTTLTNTHILVGNASNVATDVAMSGDATIANTGAVTLATVNANVGSFTNANITVNAKGLITAASNGTSGSGITVVNKNANYTVVSGDNGTYFTLDTSGTAFTLTLPTPSSGFHIKFVDSTGSFETNNLTLAPSSTEKIEGLAASKAFQTSWGGWEVFSNGTDWFII